MNRTPGWLQSSAKSIQPKEISFIWLFESIEAIDVLPQRKDLRITVIQTV